MMIGEFGAGGLPGAIALADVTVDGVGAVAVILARVALALVDVDLAVLSRVTGPAAALVVAVG